MIIIDTYSNLIIIVDEGSYRANQ